MSVKSSRKKRQRSIRRMEPGAPPGELKVDPDALQSSIKVMAYGPKEFEERRAEDVGAVGKLMGKYPVIWVHVEGLGSAELIQTAGELFDVHPLALEDVVNVHQRAKVEEYDEQIFMVASLPSNEQRLTTEQISVFLGKEFVLSFQETSTDWFESVRHRIRNGRGRIRTAGADHLAHALLDTVVDHYYPVLEHLGERLEVLEDQITSDPDGQAAAAVHDARQDLMSLRRAVWPMRDALNSLMRSETGLIKKHTRTYLRDCADHVVQILDHLEIYREMGSGLMDVHLASMSNRMNEVMKILTMIATIFIPLSFVAGLYGMNFNPGKSPLNMPELNWYFGYPFALLVMAVISGGLVYFFRRKGWFGSGR